MEELQQKLQAIDWSKISDLMHNQGYAIVPGLFSSELCQCFIKQYDNAQRYRKTVVMERYRFGYGEYKYYDYPLPEVVQLLRERLYPELVPIANQWMQQLAIEKQFPATFAGLQNDCWANQQCKPTALILKYGQGGFNTLHQDLYGEVYFPIQTAVLLNDPVSDFSGGEFVLTQQNPRAQSRAMVIPLQRGDMLVFTTNFRPVKSVRGYYRATMRHGVSEVRSGQRHALGVIFHDATS
jgi:uncharacterized protein